jgi:catechol 2,3-dioxygenase-like lactoylglutathione lyase family enzyme
MIKIREIDHVVLRVINPEKMLQFYCGVLGCVIERQQKELGLIQLRAGRSLIDFVAVEGKLGQKGGAAPGPEGRNMDHLCLRLDPFDGEATKQYLIAHGIEPGEISSRYGAEGEGPSIYIKDPEDNMVELKGAPW